MAALVLDAAVPEVTPRYVREQLPRLRAGGLDVVLSTVSSLEPPAAAVAAMGAWWEVHHDAAVPVRVCVSVSEIRAAAAAGELAVVLHFQGAEPLGGQLSMLDAYAHLGLRVMQVSYNAAGALADGCLAERDAGLTELGRKAVRRMESLGIAVDVSHAGDRACRDVLAIASRPVIASHANARALCDSPRNLHDDVIDMIGASGGMVGVCAFPAFVAASDPTLDRLIDHVVHIAERIGIDRVGLGLDFADEDEADYEYYGYDERYYPRPPWVWPTGIAWWEDTANIPAALRARGLSDAEVAGVMGENFLRVLDGLWT
jgi:membrane dipeptidase